MYHSTASLCAPLRQSRRDRVLCKQQAWRVAICYALCLLYSVLRTSACYLRSIFPDSLARVAFVAAPGQAQLSGMQLTLGQPSNAKPGSVSARRASRLGSRWPSSQRTSLPNLSSSLGCLQRSLKSHECRARAMTSLPVIRPTPLDQQRTGTRPELTTHLGLIVCGHCSQPRRVAQSMQSIRGPSSSCHETASGLAARTGHLTKGNIYVVPATLLCSSKFPQDRTR